MLGETLDTDEQVTCRLNSIPFKPFPLHYNKMIFKNMHHECLQEFRKIFAGMNLCSSMAPYICSSAEEHAPDLDGMEIQASQ